MAIKLKTEPEWVKRQIECERGIIGRTDPDTHDAAVAHALVRAIQEGGYHAEIWIEERAKQILRDDFCITED